MAPALRARSPSRATAASPDHSRCPRIRAHPRCLSPVGPPPARQSASPAATAGTPTSTPCSSTPPPDPPVMPEIDPEIVAFYTRGLEDGRLAEDRGVLERYRTE